MVPPALDGWQKRLVSIAAGIAQVIAPY